MRKLTVILMTGALLLGSSIGAAGQENATTPAVAVGLDVSYFVGTQECEWGHTGTEFVDGVEHYAEHFSCVTETTDPRVNGTEELDIIVYGVSSVGGPWTADGVLSDGEGSWRGSGEGMVDYRGPRRSAHLDSRSTTAR